MLRHLFARLPDWAEELGRIGYARMIRCLESDLDGRGLSFLRRESTLLVEPSRTVIRLRALASVLAISAQSDWSEIVMQTVAEALAETEWSDHVSQRAMNLENVQSQLRIVMAAEATAGIGRSIVSGAHACVAVASSHRVWVVSEEVAQEWRMRGGCDDDLFALALSLTPTIDDAVCTVVLFQPIPEERAVRVVCYERFDLRWFAASCAARLHELECGPRGLLFAVPNVHCILLKRLEDSADIGSLASMVEATRELHSASPEAEAVSTSLFWNFRGSVRPLGVSVGPSGVHFYPDEEFEREVLFRRRD